MSPGKRVVYVSRRLSTRLSTTTRYQVTGTGRDHGQDHGLLCTNVTRHGLHARVITRHSQLRSFATVVTELVSCLFRNHVTLFTHNSNATPRGFWCPANVRCRKRLAVFAHHQRCRLQLAVTSAASLKAVNSQRSLSSNCTQRQSHVFWHDLTQLLHSCSRSCELNQLILPEHVQTTHVSCDQLCPVNCKESTQAKNYRAI